MTAPTTTATLAQRLPRLAEHLGDGWGHGAGHHAPTLDGFLYGPDGEQVHVYAGAPALPSEAGRLRITGTLPDAVAPFRLSTEHTPRITVAAARDDAAVAAQVRSRLLPGYQRFLATMTARATASADRHAERAGLVRGVTTALRGSRWLDHSDRVVWGADRAPFSGQVDVPAVDGPVKFEVHVPRDRAAEFAALLDWMR